MSDTRPRQPIEVVAARTRYAAFGLLGQHSEVLCASYGAQRFERHCHEGFSLGVVTAGASVSVTATGTGGAS